MKKIDALPTGPEWFRDVITVTGNMMDAEDNLVEGDLELWRRDPLECIRDLIQNPAFNELMVYAPEKVYCDSKGHIRVYDEMWTGDWWSELQVSFCCDKSLRENLLWHTETIAKGRDYCCDGYLLG